VFIECPPPSEEIIRAAAQDIQLPEKTIAALNHVDPFDEKVHNPETMHPALFDLYSII
jgi:hypothetical protein